MRQKPTLAEKIEADRKRDARHRKLVYYQVTARARQRGCDALSFSEFEELWLAAKGRCELTGIRFSAKRVEGSLKRPWMPSVDRIDSTRGYEKGNCRLVCVAVNIALNDFGFAVLCKVAGALVDKRRRNGLWRVRDAAGAEIAFRV